jgi:hypothetical protein
MATFFGEVVSGSYRYFDDEDEDALDNIKEVTFKIRSCQYRVLACFKKFWFKGIVSRETCIN